jgi:hypothetical protein
VSRFSQAATVAVGRVVKGRRTRLVRRRFKTDRPAVRRKSGEQSEWLGGVHTRSVSWYCRKIVAYEIRLAWLIPPPPATRCFLSTFSDTWVSLLEPANRGEIRHRSGEEVGRRFAVSSSSFFFL